MCGEHYCDGQELFRGRGSSPHVRGAHNTHHASGDSAGIIPACAGSTSSKTSGITLLRDHPRMCGEHKYGFTFGRVNKGSSPHVRGALVFLVPSSQKRGIIPACAGSTCGVRCVMPDRRDHPRMCGEHVRSATSLSWPSGSSPHVRGAPVRISHTGSGRGIIPACAGST